MIALLPDDVLKKYLRAGSIASRVRNFVRDIVHEGMPILELCSKVESTIIKSGGRPAFPCNVCVNEIAAHYTSPPFDSAIILRKAIVKVDIGVHVEGYIADTAITISFDPAYSSLVDSVEKALNDACRMMKLGTKVSDIGRIVQSTLSSRGFKPIRNLQGHRIMRFIVHAGKSIPNVPDFDGSRLETDEVYAVEPFATLDHAAGKVTSLKESFIFRYMRDVPIEDEKSSFLLKKIKSDFRTLPFAKRWIYGLLPPSEFERAFSILVSRKAIMGYPVLREMSGNVVAQAEHTVIVTEKEPIVTTL